MKIIGDFRLYRLLCILYRENQITRKEFCHEWEKLQKLDKIETRSWIKWMN